MTTNFFAEWDIYNDWPKYIRYGQIGFHISVIRKYFDDLGYKIADSSTFDKTLLIVTKDFQRHNGLKVDGIIGPKTKGAMEFSDSENYCPEVYEDILNNSEDVSCCQLERYCLTKSLKGLSWAFLEASETNSTNVLHNIAHAILESASGTSFIARMKNNLYGFRAYDSSPYASAGRFKDFPDCIYTWTKWWKEKYLLSGGKYYNGNNEKGVNVKYATSQIAGVNKAFIVQDLREKLRRI